MTCQHFSGNWRCRWTAYRHYGYSYNLLYNKYWYWNPPIYYGGFYHHTRYYHPLQTKPVRYNLYKGAIESLICMALTTFRNDIFQIMKSLIRYGSKPFAPSLTYCLENFIIYRNPYKRMKRRSPSTYLM